MSVCTEDNKLNLSFIYKTNHRISWHSHRGEGKHKIERTISNDGLPFYVFPREGRNEREGTVTTAIADLEGKKMLEGRK